MVMVIDYLALSQSHGLSLRIREVSEHHAGRLSATEQVDCPNILLEAAYAIGSLSRTLAVRAGPWER